MIRAAICAALLFASPAFAGWEAYDASVNYIGQPLMIAPSFDGTEFPVARPKAILAEIDGEPVWFGMDPDTMQFETLGVFFTSANCSGQALRLFDPDTAIAIQTFDGTFWPPADPAMTTITTINSAIDETGICGSITFTTNAAPVEPFDPQPTWTEPIQIFLMEPQIPPVGAQTGIAAAVLAGWMGLVGWRRLRRQGAPRSASM